jgi:hypothetical protein
MKEYEEIVRGKVLVTFVSLINKHHISLTINNFIYFHETIARSISYEHHDIKTLISNLNFSNKDETLQNVLL